MIDAAHTKLYIDGNLNGIAQMKLRTKTLLFGFSLKILHQASAEKKTVAIYFNFPMNPPITGYYCFGTF